MFIRPNESELKSFKPDFIVYNACKTTNEDYKKDNLNSEVFVIFNIEENIAVIGGTWYGGDEKRDFFYDELLVTLKENYPCTARQMSEKEM